MPRSRRRRTASGCAQALAVRPVGRHRVVRVADEDDPRLERDRLARAARPGSRRRPSARGSGGRSRRTSCSRSIGAMIRSPSSGCVSMTARSSAVSRPGFERISLGIADLADVVQERAELEPLQRALAEAELAADAQREVGDPARVRRRVLVVRLERVRERLDGRDERPLEPFVVGRVRDRELRLVREPAEQPQLALAEVALRDRGDDAAAAPADDERRDRVRRVGVDGGRLDPRERRPGSTTNGSRPDSRRLAARDVGSGAPRRGRCSSPCTRRPCAAVSQPVVVRDPDRRARRADQVRRQARRRARRSRRGSTPSRARARTRAASSRSPPRGAPTRRGSRSRPRRRRGRRAPRAAARRPRRTGRGRASR